MTWFRPAGTLAHGADPVWLDPPRAGWEYSGLRVVHFDADELRIIDLPHDEAILVPLSGSYGVAYDGWSCLLEGRATVFGELTDRCFVPAGGSIRVKSPSGGELAVATARAPGGGEPLYLAGPDTRIEVRGAGQATRQVNGLWAADVPGPERIIVVEVITPAGNWSSYPPHKHDEWGEGEVPLEEVYYFRISGPAGFGFHRTYTADGQFDESVTVADGDVYLIPRGYHGPCVAAPGYDMYYLNVMAGPERAWDICTDPAHAWVMSEWDDSKPDPRLPMSTEAASAHTKERR